MTEERLARRYHALLVFYPRRYREERGAELVGTLLDCARPGQTRPTWREARSLVIEGLRMGAPRVTGADVLRLVVLVALAMGTLGAATEWWNSVDAPAWPAALAGAIVAGGAVPFALVALGRFRAAVPFVLVGGLAGVAQLRLFLTMDDTYHLPMFSVVALAGLAALWRRPAGRIQPGPLVFATVPPLLLWLPSWLPYDWPVALDDRFWYGQVLPVALLYLGALAYVAVDPRPALALAAFLALYAARVVAILVPAGVPLTEPAGFLAVLLVAAAIAVGAAGLGVRRRVAPAKVEG